MLLLCTADVEVLALEVLAVKLLNGSSSTLVRGEVDETEATRLALVVTS